MSNLKVKLGDWELDNPIIPASGTYGFGYEFTQFYDINMLGSIALKGTTLEERFGNPTPRIAECEAGMLNAIGLQNPGVQRVVDEELPKLREVFHKGAIANISGFSIEEYITVAKMMDACDEIALLELNISCPNVHGGGMAFGQDPAAAAEVTAAVKAQVKKPLYVKLSPNVTSIVPIAKAVEAAGADGISLINTLLGMRIEPRTGKPIVSIGSCGFSGPAVKPVALHMVYQVYANTNLPIIGLGGVSNADDVIEMMSAGASAVQVGTANLIDPYACKNIIEELPLKMKEYGIENLSDIIGRGHAK